MPCLICASTMASAKKLWGMGSTIGEIDMLLWIEQRLKNFERTGKLADMQEEFQARVKHKVSNPPLSQLEPPRPQKRFM